MPSLDMGVLCGVGSAGGGNVVDDHTCGSSSLPPSGGCSAKVIAGGGGARMRSSATSSNNSIPSIGLGPGSGRATAVTAADGPTAGAFATAVLGKGGAADAAGGAVDAGSCVDTIRWSSATSTGTSAPSRSSNSVGFVSYGTADSPGSAGAAGRGDKSCTAGAEKVGVERCDADESCAAPEAAPAWAAGLSTVVCRFSSKFLSVAAGTVCTGNTATPAGGRTVTAGGSVIPGPQCSARAARTGPPLGTECGAVVTPSGAGVQSFVACGSHRAVLYLTARFGQSAPNRCGTVGSAGAVDGTPILRIP
mmetsp:Transcript_79021/g.211151  ORF Transcript_79021/g.211151 Transcript_79021/m.211151 type:complete len:306 (-) Transcript_79021:295-1212(-)